MNKLKKLVAVTLSLALMLVTLTACGSKDKKTVSVVVPDGVPSIAMSKLISEKTQADDKHEITYSIENTADTLATEVMKGNPDIAIVPSTLAAQAYNKDLGYQLVGTTGWGSLYLISTDEKYKTEEVLNIGDLKGQEIYNIGKGLTPDIVFKTLLEKNGIKEEEVTLNYVGSPSELAPLVISGKTKYAVVPEPVLTTIIGKNKNVSVVANLNNMWSEAFECDNGFPQASIIAKSDFIENNKEFLNEFLDKVSEGIEWVNSNPEEASKAAIENGSKVEEAVIQKSIENINVAFSKAKNDKLDYSKYYEALNKINSKTIGGKVPDDKFFYEG